MYAARNTTAVSETASVTPWSTAQFGTVKRTYAAVAATNDPCAAAPDLDAWARHAGHASGFGDAAGLGEGAPQAPVAAVPDTPATSLRSYALAEIAGAACAALTTAARRAVARWRDRRNARATVQALLELDARTLQDIGLNASEAVSIAAELAGAVEESRIRVLRSTRALLG